MINKNTSKLSFFFIQTFKSLTSNKNVGKATKIQRKNIQQNRNKHMYNKYESFIKNILKIININNYYIFFPISLNKKSNVNMQIIYLFI